jgi:ADP-ribose pyrophosphatase YjhB (NUDIX family)
MKETVGPILDRKITRPDREPEFGPPDQGLALLIFNRNGEILLGKENGDDERFGRRDGQWNILTETREPGETIKHTLDRALREELGADYYPLFRVIGGSYRETNTDYVRMMGYDYTYRCLCLAYRGPDIPADDLFRSPGGEILKHEWVPYADLGKFDLEDCARMVIDYYIESIPPLFME